MASPPTALSVRIAATFPAESIKPVLEAWLRRGGLDAEVKLAPHNQLHRQLLDPGSMLAGNPDGVNVILVRSVDLGVTAESRARAAAREVAAALSEAVSRDGTRTMLMICPVAGAGRAEETFAADLDDQLDGLSGVEMLDAGEVERLYPVGESSACGAGEPPGAAYCEDMLVALASYLARRITAFQRKPYKVIAVDCDGTLWAGSCAGCGPCGVVVDAPRQAFQSFLMERRAEGTLLCLVSRNAAEDVEAVFRENPAMIIPREAFVDAAINWQSKSANLAELAGRLNLGLDGFLLLDDDAAEIAEVEAGAPAVLAVQMPEDPAVLPAFLDHLWVFDRIGPSVEDAKRADFYHDEARRREMREQAANFTDFIETLQLEVEIRPMIAADVARASQLTRLTNQFNAWPRPRDEAAMLEACRGMRPESVVVRDRFGDHGTVGLMLTREDGGRLWAETFLLNCRAVGKGVEHRMVRHLGRVALQFGLDKVAIWFRDTGRNQPCRDFLDSIRDGCWEDELWVVPAVKAASCLLLPVAAKPCGNRSVATVPREDSVLVAQVAHELRTVDAIRRWVASDGGSRMRGDGMPGGADAGPRAVDGSNQRWREMVCPVSGGPREDRPVPDPELPAVFCGGDSLSFGELSARAGAVARSLVDRGAGPGSFVGVAVERSLDQLIGLWGTVLSGAAYVPLDPGYPRERLDHMLSAARISTVVTTSRNAGLFPPAELVLVDQAAAATGAGWSPPAATAEHPMYAIFTSGSTGLPKSAVVLRKGFSNLLQWYLREFAFGPDDRTLVISSPAFDLTQKNLFAPLLAGGRLVLDVADCYDIGRISGLIRDHGITVMNCTPSAFYPLLDAAEPGGFADLASLRLVVLGGEPIVADRLRDWLNHPSCRAGVANTYGPTECTDICAFHRLDRANLDATPFVPLGREIDGARVEVLDEQLQPVADGETGELYIAGAGVGAGYLHDPDRTALRFVPNPLPGRPGGETIYRSGDLVRRHAGGLLEFRGRVDHQAKIRGNRVEPGEVEVALSGQAGVQAAVVIAVEHAAGEHRLVAWIEPESPERPPSPADMQARLASRLPDYMVPREYQLLDSFPLTPNGKVDRIALAGLLGERAAPAVAAAAPDDPGARVMAMWSDVLGRDLTDRDANFFDLGATSIDLAVVHARLREEFRSDFPITGMFAHPTVRRLVAFLVPQGATGKTTMRAADRARQQQLAFARFRRAPAR